MEVLRLRRNKRKKAPRNAGLPSPIRWLVCRCWQIGGHCSSSSSQPSTTRSRQRCRPHSTRSASICMDSTICKQAWFTSLRAWEAALALTVLVRSHWSPRKPRRAGLLTVHTGKFVDWNYRRTVDRLAKTQGSQYDKRSPEFPLEKTRLRGVYVLSATTVLGIIGYGLTLKFRWVRLADSKPILGRSPLMTPPLTLLAHRGHAHHAAPDGNGDCRHIYRES